jgi:tetratricopeptide (TPR) repeat protein
MRPFDWKSITYIVDCLGLIYKVSLVDKKETSMTSTMARITLLSFLFLLFIPHLTFAETKTFIKEYTYQASEVDSKQTSRILALDQVKRLLLEELGTYLESETIVKNFQMTSDQIKILTSGIVSTRVLEERWNGTQYWLKAEISSDPEEVARSIDMLRRDRQKMKDIEATNDSLKIALKDIERLKNELGKSNKKKIKKEYQKQINKMAAADLRFKGMGYTLEAITTGNYGYYQKAIDAYEEAIILDPQNVETYKLCAWPYTLLKKHKQAVNISNKLIKRYPKLADGYFSRGLAYYWGGDYSQAIKDFDIVIKLDPDQWTAFSYKGQSYFNKQDYVKAINALTIAINIAEKKLNQNDNSGWRKAIPITEEEFNSSGKGNESVIYEATPIDETTNEIIPRLQLTSDYGLRGRAYYLIGNNKLAISDFSNAIKLLPKYRENGLIYALRAQANFEDQTNWTDSPLSNNFLRFLSDINEAIELNPNDPEYYSYRAKLNLYYSIGLIKEHYDNTGFNYEQVKQKAKYDTNSAEFVRIIESIKNQMDIDSKIATNLKSKGAQRIETQP